MTVSTTTSKVSFSGNGSTTAFAVGFYFLSTSHLKVVLRAADGTETVKTLTTDYTVSGAGNPSGGTVTMVTAPASGVTVVIARNVPQTQLVDYQPNDPFPANTHEQALDQLTMEVQQLQEQITRALKLSLTNTMNSTEFTVDATTRALKVLGFDAAGELVVTQELGTYKGNWATGSAYKQRDLIKDTSNNNIYLCLTAHTASGAQPISTNTDSAKWGLIVDSASATSSASAAASSASAAATSATNAATSASSASTSASTATTQASNASTSASSASSSASSASTSATNASNSATSAANSATAAAAAAAAGLYRQVLDKSANYTVVSADSGTLFRMNTGSGALTVTLPQISTVTDGFKVSVVKWTGDGNGVTIARSGSDTINGATSSTIGAQYSQTTFVADFETNQWFASSSGLGSTNVSVDVFSGNGSTTAFTLSGDPGTKNNTWVHIGGVYQNKSTYSQSGTTITFSTAPPSGSSNVEIVWTQPLSVGVPSDGSVTYPKLSADVQGAMYGFKNRIINGAMMIDQRNAGAAVSVNNAVLYTIDRWIGDARGAAGNGIISFQQSTDAPVGYKNSLQATLTTQRTSPTVGDVFATYQKIEGYNCADLGFGTANAQTVTVSFWVKSSVAGTYSGALENGAQTRSYPFSFTINASNTWEQKSVTIAGDQAGTWVTDNTTGLWVMFDLGCGSNYQSTAGSWSSATLLGVTGTVRWAQQATNSTFKFTGVQLEKGSTATSFDYRDYGRELALCQRYYWKITGSANYPAGSGVSTGATAANFYVKYPVTMRTGPTFSQNNTVVNIGNTSINITSIVQSFPGSDTALIQAGVASGLTATQGALWLLNATTSYVDATAEL